MQDATSEVSRTAGELRQLIHLLNRRYRDEFDRAERLRAELADIHGSRTWRLFAWLRRVRRAFSFRRSRPANQRTSVPLPCQPLLPQGRVSIVIPFRDQAGLLANCLRSLGGSLYRRFEIVLVDNGSSEPATRRLLQRLERRRRIAIVSLNEPFNFSRLCNAGAEQARGDYLLFLNNDIEVLTPNWLDQMLLVARQKHVGVVGATLLYPDGTVQHAGLAEHEGIWSHVHRGEPFDENGPAELRQVRAVPAVSGACLLIRRQLFHRLGGFDERLPVTRNDTDLCRRVREQGLRVAITPHARLLHFESLSRGYEREQAA